MEEMGHGAIGSDRMGSMPTHHDYGPTGIGEKLDQLVESIGPKYGLIRKYADSMHFNKFRPFPLGNVNTGGGVVFTERTPTRNMHQGMLPDAVMATNVVSTPARSPSKKRGLLMKQSLPINNTRVDVWGSDFYNMLIGEYPSYSEVVENLRDPDILNEGCAFHRNYSVLRGPLGMLFLCYQHHGVGMIEKNDHLVLASSHEYLKEEITELKIFKSMFIKEV
jgi:hypothetical protein